MKVISASILLIRIHWYTRQSTGDWSIAVAGQVHPLCPDYGNSGWCPKVSKLASMTVRWRIYGSSLILVVSYPIVAPGIGHLFILSDLVVGQWWWTGGMVVRVRCGNEVMVGYIYCWCCTCREERRVRMLEQCRCRVGDVEMPAHIVRHAIVLQLSVVRHRLPLHPQPDDLLKHHIPSTSDRWVCLATSNRNPRQYRPGLPGPYPW